MLHDADPDSIEDLTMTSDEQLQRSTVGELTLF
jgi:hypothetical protein